VKCRLALVSLCVVLGCGRARFEGTDAGPSRDASMDAARDAAAIDASTPDAPSVDAGSDAPSLDASLDAPATPDAFAPDAFAPDAFAPDAFAPDVFAPDAFAPDAFAPDAASPCGDLRLYYQFDEASGPVLDSSGCGNHGVARSVATGEPGRVGSAYRFQRAGVADAHVLVADSPSLSALAGLTIEAWVRHTGGNFQAIVDHGDLMGGDPFVLHTYSSRDPAMTLGNHPACIGGTSFRSSVTLPVDTWAHVAVTLDTRTGALVFYLNGAEIHREASLLTSGSLCDNAEAMLVGAARPDGTWGWQGWIDELRIWGVVRTPSEVCIDAGGAPGVGGGCAIP
jgi:hypothetical protein